MRSKKYHFLLVFLFGLEILSLVLVYKTFSNKDVKAIKEIMEIDKKQFAMYVENEEGKYKEYTSSNIFPNGYKINLTKSNCVDTKGNKIDEILSGTSTSVTVTSNKTAYCYIYFDIDYSLSELCKTGDILSSCLTINNDEIDSLNDNFEGGLYRYQGTNEIVDDNYICFGTNNKEECIGNTNTYMYRIIGIDENNQLKLIKKEALNETLEWHNNHTTDITWPNSDMYKNINGDKYLTNSTYMPSGWSNKIATINWKYGDKDTVDINSASMYNTEKSWTNSTNAKVGLMYLSDYYYAYQTEGLNCNASYKICKLSWLFLGNNDNESDEWTMTRYGYYSDNGYYYASGINAIGYSSSWAITGPYSVRPVFYLNADEVYADGDGTIDNPIIISDIN